MNRHIARKRFELCVCTANY